MQSNSILFMPKLSTPEIFRRKSRECALSICADLFQWDLKGPLVKAYVKRAVKKEGWKEAVLPIASPLQFDQKRLFWNAEDH